MSTLIITVFALLLLAYSNRGDGFKIKFVLKVIGVVIFPLAYILLKLISREVNLRDMKQYYLYN